MITYFAKLRLLFIKSNNDLWLKYPPITQLTAELLAPTGLLSMVSFNL